MTFRPLVAPSLVIALVLASAAARFVPAHASAGQPETVVITLRPKADAVDALATIIARHWETASRLDLVTSDVPHVTLRGTDADGKPYFVEILTWRDASVPDHAPQAIVAIWAEMNAQVESRGGRPGLEIAEMTAVR